VAAAIPSPSSDGFPIGPLFVHAYGLMYVLAIAAAVWLTRRLWQGRGGDPRSTSLPGHGRPAERRAAALRDGLRARCLGADDEARRPRTRTGRLSQGACGNAWRMRKVMGAVVAAAAIAVAGCGGDDEGPSTGSATGTGAATVELQPAPAPRADTDAAYQDYVDELEPILEPVMDAEEMTDRVRDIFGVLPEKPGDAWDEAAGKVDALAEDMGDTASEVQQVPPPKGMVSAHERLVSAYTTSNALFGDIADALRAHDLDELKVALGVDQSGTQPRAWLAAMRDATEEHGVKLPAWLQQYVQLLAQQPSTATD